MSEAYGPPEPLRSDHNVTNFDCGVAELNEFIRRWALENHRSGSARTKVVVRGDEVVAYYSLAAGSVHRGRVSQRIAQGQPTKIPVLLLARLAVDLSEQGRGLGAAMLKDCLKRVALTAEEIGVRALLVHAKDERAREFYEHFGFESSPTDELQLLLLIKDLRLALGLSGL